MPAVIPDRARPLSRPGADQGSPDQARADQARADQAGPSVAHAADFGNAGPAAAPPATCSGVPSSGAAGLAAARTDERNALHVVHVMESFAAGCLVALATICRETPGVRHEIIHAIRPETPPDFRALFPAGVTFHYLPMTRNIRPLRDMAAFLGLRRLLKRLKPDVVHCHSSKAGVLGRWAARSLGLPSLHTPHGYAFLRTDVGRFRRGLFRLGEWLGTRAGTAIAACGREECELARRLSGPGKRVYLIPNALNLAALDSLDLRGRQAQEGRQPDAQAAPVLAGTCGRIDIQRNPPLFAELARRTADVARWTWIGEGRDNRLLPPEVERTGWLEHDEALRRVAALDIYVQTSLWEGLSYAILEAMALGRPVVVSAVPANREIVRHGVTGFLGADAAEMAAHVRRLATDADLRRRMGEAARDYVRRHHDARRNGRVYARLYARLAGRPR